MSLRQGESELQDREKASRQGESEFQDRAKPSYKKGRK